MRIQAPIRVGVVGIGFGQHVTFPRSAAISAFGWTPSARAHRRAAAAVAERLSIPRAQGDWRAMVQDPELDALALSVPPQLQAEIALATVHVGKHSLRRSPWPRAPRRRRHRRYGEGKPDRSERSISSFGCHLPG